MQPLQLLLLEFHRLTHGSQAIHFLHQLGGELAQRFGNLQAQTGDLLYHSIHGNSLHGRPGIGFLLPQKLFPFRLGGPLPGFDIFSNRGEFFLHLGSGTLGANWRFG